MAAWTGSRSTAWLTLRLMTSQVLMSRCKLVARMCPCLYESCHRPCPALSCPAASTDHVMINCYIIIGNPSPKPCRHTQTGFPRSLCSRESGGSAEWKSPRLWLTVLQSTSTWKNKLASGGLSKWRHRGVKYRCNIPPFQLNPNKLKMSFLQDGYHRERS